MSAMLNQAASPDIHLSGIDTSGAKTFGDVLRILVNRYEQFILPEDPATTWADKQKPSVNIPLRSAFIQQVHIMQQEIDDIREETIAQLKREEESDKLKGRHKPLSERQKDGVIQDRTESQVTKLRISMARIMQTELLGEDVVLTGFAQEEVTIEKLRKILLEQQ